MSAFRFANKQFRLVMLVVLILLGTGLSDVRAATDDPPVTAARDGGPTGYVVAWRLNVRSGPDTSYPVLAVAQFKEVMSLTARNSASTWLRVLRANGQQGWASANYIMVSAAHLSALPVIDTAPPVPIPPLPSGPVGRVAAYRLNVRASPSLNANRINTLNLGDWISLLGRDTSSTWLQVKLPDQSQGWVAARYIWSSIPITTLPITGGAVPLPVPGATGYVTAGKLNVRSGPGLDYGIMGWLYRDQQVRLEGRNEAGTWLKVELATDHQGWVYAYYVRSDVPIPSLPVIH
jgi:N-acetylmuramoyl-L-alanine amidase